ncbi:MAG TPA: hypothetical protein VFY29_10200 [Terriglobia bacterium]|nr:hypothetical protein [Terriglobia bacterium]
MLLKIAIVVLVVGLLETSERYRSMRRSVDEFALLALKRAARAAEDHGYPPEFIPMLLLLTLLSWMALAGLTELFGR